MTVTRFAPSPTGRLHLGHAYAALFAAAVGDMHLRIEDIDVTRCRPEFAAAIREDLDWLGIPVDGEPIFQSQRIAAYQAALTTLSDRGLIYPCFCTRKDITAAAGAPHGHRGPIYPGICRAISSAERNRRMQTEPYALRLNAAAAATLTGPLWFEETGAGPYGETGRIAVDPTRFGDVVLARKDIAIAYHLAAVIDDAYQGVDLVTRGEDLFAATHVQRLLQALLGLPTPAYRHHKLILDENGKKFSKRDHAVTLAALRAEGATANGIRARLGF